MVKNKKWIWQGHIMHRTGYIWMIIPDFVVVRVDGGLNLNVVTAFI